LSDYKKRIRYLRWKLNDNRLRDWAALIAIIITVAVLIGLILIFHYSWKISL
jgi:hypothetical protein